jgi:hypothetical protein
VTHKIICTILAFLLSAVGGSGVWMLICGSVSRWLDPHDTDQIGSAVLFLFGIPVIALIAGAIGAWLWWRGY